MDKIQMSDVLALLAEADGPVVSLYAPMQPPNQDTRQNPLQFRNLLSQAETQWSALGLDRKQFENLLRPAAGLLEEEGFWRLQGNALAAFLSKHGLRRWRLAANVKPQVYTGRCFHVRPLLRCVDPGELFVLAVSQKQVRFWQANGQQMREIRVPSVAKGLEETLNFVPRDGDFQFHSSRPALRGKEGAAFHGQGGADDARKDEILAYFREIDRAIAPYLQDQRAPLYFAGVGYLFPIYREANNYRHLVPEPFEGNPESLSADELRARATRHMQSKRAPLRDALRRFDEAGSGLRSNNLAEIALAANHGRVDTLFVTEDSHQWGRIPSDATDVVFLESPDAESVDLYERAVSDVLTNRGSVFVLNQDEMPNGDLIAASYRYAMQ